MTKLVWHQDIARYEFGVDRGVFYLPTPTNQYDNGVVWNGLVDVTESSVGGDRSAYYYDGIKYLDIVAPRNYQAQISAYSAPNRFMHSLGEIPLIPGFILTRQARSLFGLSYRTFIGDNVGYKIHLVYHAMASATAEVYSSVGETTDPDLLSWTIDAVPPVGVKHRPTAHYILDSTKTDPNSLEALEQIIYGTDDTTARLPSIEELLGLIALWSPVLIGGQTIPGLAELEPGMGDLYSIPLEGFYKTLPQTRLVRSPVDGLYRLE